VVLGLSSELTTVGNVLRVTLTSVFSLFIMSGSIDYLRGVREIRVTDDGMVTLVRAVGSTQLTASDIWKLAGKFDTDEDGKQFWTLTMRYGKRGREKLDEFNRATDLRDLIVEHNPKVIINGLWPEWAPPRPGNPSFVSPLGPES
jgi:hypothetical protein